MGNITKPLIERFGDDIPIDPCRKKAAKAICRYFENENDSDCLNGYYDAIKYLLHHEDSRRIIYYLPFEELVGARGSVQNEYVAAWTRMLYRQDVRENFHKGDIFEPDARPNGELEWVIKCAHLTPWLLRAQYIDEDDLLDIVGCSSHRDTALQSFRDTWDYIDDHKLVSTSVMKELRKLTEKVPPRRKHQPLYTSTKRQEWLNEISKSPAELSTPNALLQGPFSPNLEAIHDRIEKIKSSIGPNDIILMGGSQIKGYGTVDSDFDIWDFYDVAYNDKFRLGTPEGAHIYFNSIWITGRNILKDMSELIIKAYRSDDYPSYMITERLENDLLQYRLLHKGFSRFTGRTLFETSKYKEMDGDCPFYDREYRKIATMLYAKYVLIP